MFYSKWLLKRSPVRVGATISELSSTQTPKDMVFSQTSHKTHSILKLVEIDRLKHGKSQQVNGSIGVFVESRPVQRATSPTLDVTTSFSEDFLKLEPVSQSEMFHDSDCEFFQDLVQWCAAPTEEEAVQSIDSQKNTETRTLNTNTLHTPISSQSWDVLDSNSPTTQAAVMFNSSSSYPVSPSADGLTKFSAELLDPLDLINENRVTIGDEFFDISNLPVVIGGLESEDAVDLNLWQPQESVGCPIHYTDYTKTNTTVHNPMPFIYQDDSLDTKYPSVIPREVERNDVVISEYIINDDKPSEKIQMEPNVDRRIGGGLSVNVATREPDWTTDDIISTPEVLSVVEQLEKEKCTPLTLNSHKKPAPVTVVETCTKIENSPVADYEPITPKSESHAESDNEDVKSPTKRRRHNSEDSDETYTPYTEHTPRKYKRRKPNIPIKDMIRALEESQQLTKARRGRPPKRRESTVSSVCSVDDNSSTVSTHEMKYRELRDKNNEASKKSRMNRKLKELQMEQLAVELEERNKRLRIRADMLEDMTKRLREAFMAAVSQKKV